MIFVNKAKQSQSQAGVSLMLAVLVLASITAIAFSVATIVFIEIRSAGDSFRTEPALYATLGVTEEALFQYKRYYDPAVGSAVFDVPNCEPANPTIPIEEEYPNICFINGVTLTMPGEQPIAFDDSPRVEFVGAGQTKVIPMYEVNNFEQEYQFIQVDVLPNETNQSLDLSFEITQEDETEPQPGPSTTVSPGTPYTYDGFGDGQYDLILENTSPNQDISVSIATVRVGNEQPDGLPFIGEQVLRIVADYVGLTRTYQVRIPIP
jgi:hypothetical protein